MSTIDYALLNTGLEKQLSVLDKAVGRIDLQLNKGAMNVSSLSATPQRLGSSGGIVVVSSDSSTKTVFTVTPVSSDTNESVVRIKTDDGVKFATKDSNQTFVPDDITGGVVVDKFRFRIVTSGSGLNAFIANNTVATEEVVEEEVVEEEEDDEGVSGEVVEAIAVASVEEEEEPETNWLLIGGVGVAVLVVLGVVAFMVMDNKKNKRYSF
ncbi:hypothetical protein SARC_03976 [Sphaeroforma arctica JP610]|uniref:Uncharacterized protein n=1 Tax=Sphaeroforma arctica JP610 TaxID=667725 RepID=A0A0L0G420_9EUKA|nr:hypothetical protein SARC_03976 [Sphaeroforma arctica JP610]KNC83800.1 hypothetical protein SARC_03976 [Sphaeroforma arctica JP610]|eukprot:XP_014157702.1 hypothetical protein SARC_03976 [Sphaeroforma arctica JP610]